MKQLGIPAKALLHTRAVRDWFEQGRQAGEAQGEASGRALAGLQFMRRPLVQQVRSFYGPKLLDRRQHLQAASGVPPNGVEAAPRRWSTTVDLVGRTSSDDASALVRAMRTTVNLDDQLLAQAQELCGPMERTSLLKEALQALVERESARRLAALAGSQADLQPVPRSKSAA